MTVGIILLLTLSTFAVAILLGEGLLRAFKIN